MTISITTILTLAGIILTLISGIWGLFKFLSKKIDGFTNKISNQFEKITTANQSERERDYQERIDTINKVNDVEKRLAVVEAKLEALPDTIKEQFATFTATICEIKQTMTDISNRLLSHITEKN